MRLAGVLIGPAVLAFLIVTGLSHVLPQPRSESQTQATGLEWNGRVFTSRTEFSQWLAERGQSYREWERQHPASPWATTGPTEAAATSGKRKPAPEADRGTSSVVVAVLGAAVVLVIGLLAIAVALLVRMTMTIDRLTEPPLSASHTVPAASKNGAGSVAALQPLLAGVALAIRRGLEAAWPRLVSACLAVRRGVEVARARLVSAGLAVRRGVEAARPRLVSAGLAVRRGVEAALPAGSDLRSALPVALVTGALAVLVVGVVSGVSLRATTLFVVLVTVAALIRPAFVPWQKIIAALILIILFIPIRRYTLPGNLPFQLEPYRIFVAFLILGWCASLLVDPRTRIRRTGFEAPIILIAAAAVGSIVANPDRVAQLSPAVEKDIMFFLSFVLVVYVTASVIRRLDSVDYLAKTLVVGGTVVALFAIVEARTGMNVFNHLDRVVPGLSLGEPEPGNFTKFGASSLRVFASAQHPIALSAALVMLTPLAVYLATRYRQRRWMVCVLLLAAGSAATVSRTGIMMFVVVGLVFLWLRPRETRRLWPALLLAPVVIHFALPGTLGALKHSFFPAGGLLAEQRSMPGESGSGRLADLGPALQEWKRDPLVGVGFGTRVVDEGFRGPRANVLDNEWLGTLLETGAVGVFGWLWLFLRVVRRLGGEAKRDDSARGWLLASIAAGVAAYAVGMLTFDSFAFIQVTFLVFIFIGLGSALLAERPTPLAVRAGRPGRAATA